MLRTPRSLGVLATLAIASVVATGCGESVDEAEQALCADIATLRADVQALGDLGTSSTIDEFRQARRNVRDSYRDAKASADNLGEEEFDAVTEAWDDLYDTIDSIGSSGSLRADRDEVRSDAEDFVAAVTEARSAVDCSDADA